MAGSAVLGVSAGPGSRACDWAKEPKRLIACKCANQQLKGMPQVALTAAVGAYGTTRGIQGAPTQQAAQAAQAAERAVTCMMCVSSSPLPKQLNASVMCMMCASSSPLPPQLNATGVCDVCFLLPLAPTVERLWSEPHTASARR